MAPLSQESLRYLDTLALKAKRAFFGVRQGAHRSQRRGHGVEFADYRQYESGDNPRAIDWNLYGRSDKLYIKRYLEEENVALYIIIDGSRSLTHPANREKWDLARDIAAAVGYIALATGDPVVVSVLGGGYSPRYSGGRGFHELQRFLGEQERSVVNDSFESCDLHRAMKLSASRISFPGIAVFISDFLYPQHQVREVLLPLRVRNMEIHAVQVLGEADLALPKALAGSGGLGLVDSESGEAFGVAINGVTQREYINLLERHNTALREQCLRSQISFTQVNWDRKITSQERALELIGRMGVFV
jgi:uncharacterized protein (DUF58 family)